MILKVTTFEAGNLLIFIYLLRIMLGGSGGPGPHDV